MRDLTHGQRLTLAFIESYIDEHGISPSQRDIQLHFGWKSPNAAAVKLLALEKKKRIKRKVGISRSIVIVRV